MLVFFGDVLDVHFGFHLGQSLVFRQLLDAVAGNQVGPAVANMKELERLVAQERDRGRGSADLVCASGSVDLFIGLGESLPRELLDFLGTFAGKLVSAGSEDLGRFLRGHSSGVKSALA